MARPLVGANVRKYQGEAIRSISVASQLLFQQAVRRMGEELPREIEQLGQALELRKIPADRLQKANVSIAMAAHEAMLKSWRSRLPRRSTDTFDTPGNVVHTSSKRLSGDLGDALANTEQNIAGTTDRRIAFINTTFMNQEARHWYRVNYGASGPNLSAGHQPETFRLAVGESFVGELRDESPPAERSFLPRRFTWVGGEMVVLRGPGHFAGAGTRAARFTDIGLSVVAHSVGDTYRDLFLGYARETVGGRQLADVDIVVTSRAAAPDLSRFGVT